MDDYRDIIDLPHKQSIKRPHMSLYNRAAQFAPFAALTGYDSAINETGRETEQRRVLTDNIIDELNEKIALIVEKITEQPEVEITFFKEDEFKDGGSYITLKGNVKKIDDFEGTITFTDGEQIAIEDIFGLDSPLFSLD